MPHEHHHIDGECYPSVTEIIHSQPLPWLEKWLLKNPVWGPKKTAVSNKIGTEFHRCVEDITKGIVPEPKVFVTRVKAMLKVFMSWFDSVQLAPYATEMKVYSRKYRYQGTFDLIGEVDGVLYIVDYKSSSGINETMGFQLAAYAYAYGEMTGVYPRKGKIVLVTKDKAKIKRSYKKVDGVRTVTRRKIPSHKLLVQDYEITPELFAEFLRLRDEMVVLPCPFATKA